MLGAFKITTKFTWTQITLQSRYLRTCKPSSIKAEELKNPETMRCQENQLNYYSYLLLLNYNRLIHWVY